MRTPALFAAAAARGIAIVLPGHGNACECRNGQQRYEAEQGRSAILIDHSISPIWIGLRIRSLATHQPEQVWLTAMDPLQHRAHNMTQPPLTQDGQGGGTGSLMGKRPAHKQRAGARNLQTRSVA